MRLRPAPAPTVPIAATVLDVRRVVATGHHNAFCSLARWREYDYLAFRQAQNHTPVFPGVIQIWRRPVVDSAADWQLCATLATGGDNRDPKLVPLDDVITCVWGTYYPRWGGSVFAQMTIPNAVYDLISQHSISRDGIVWSVPHQIYRPNYWLWSVVPERDEDDGMVLHAMAYHFGEPQDTGCLVYLHGPSLTLFRTQQWLTFETLEAPAEPALAIDMLRHELAVCVRNGDAGNALWGVGLLPGCRFAWTSLPEPVHAPVLLTSPWGTLVAGRMLRDPADAPALQKDAARRGVHAPLDPRAAARERQAGSERWLTGVALRTPQGGWQRLVTLPSWGDTSYPGLLWEDATTLQIAYYSQHDRKVECQDAHFPSPADIYLARVHLEDLSDDRPLGRPTRAT